MPLWCRNHQFEAFKAFNILYSKYTASRHMWTQPDPASCPYVTLDGRKSEKRSCESFKCKDNVNSSAYKVFNDMLYYLHLVVCWEAGLSQHMSLLCLK